MKRIVVIALLLAAVLPASSQTQFGIKLGVNVTSMSFSEKGVGANNEAGFYVGPTMKFIHGKTGVGFDLSLLYDQRQGEAAWVNSHDAQEQYMGKIRQQQISVPINLRWEWDFTRAFGIFLYGGPEYSVNISKDIDEYDWHWQPSHWSANLGLGILLFNHLQVNGNYNFAIGRGGRFHDNPDYHDNKGRFNAWQVGVAYFF